MTVAGCESCDWGESSGHQRQLRVTVTLRCKVTAVIATVSRIYRVGSVDGAVDPFLVTRITSALTVHPPESPPPLSCLLSLLFPSAQSLILLLSHAIFLTAWMDPTSSYYYHFSNSTTLSLLLLIPSSLKTFTGNNS